MPKYLPVLILPLVLFVACDSSSDYTLYNPANTGYDNYAEEPVHVYAERANDGIAESDTFYVSADGDDGAAGSIDAPWRTIQTGIDRIGPGQKLYVRGGVYSGAVWFNASG